MMNRKKSLTFVMVFMVLCLLQALILPVAGATPPTSVSAPENFAAVNSNGGAGLNCTLSAPDDLRALISQTDKERGFGMKIMAQVDFKTDNGNWHHSADWDNPSTYIKYVLNFYNTLSGGEHNKYLGHNGFLFKTIFPDETNVPVPSAYHSWDWYKSHSITVRARFVVEFGKGNLVFSDWSKEYIISDAVKMDYKKIMEENAPVLLSSKIETIGVNKVPWVLLQLGRHPNDVQMFNAASGDGMQIEVWLRKQGDTEFKNVGASPFSQETVFLNVGEYFDEKLNNYDAQAYEVKVRYIIDERKYQQSNATKMVLLNSRFSNTLSYGMPAWSDASEWATPELKKAGDMGLIPESLQGADMKKNITREEFAEVALLMYQKATGILDTQPVEPNPFTDTTNPQILKAFKLGIVKGVSAIEFMPEALINREQVAAILARTIRLIAPDADYSIDGAPEFSDRRDISDWALNDCLYMAKIGIIKGTDGKFMPRAITDAQKAVGYANTSREQALAMSVRVIEKLDDGK